VVLAVLHRNALGVDEFLGQVRATIQTPSLNLNRYFTRPSRQVALPLRDYDVYEKPRARWLPLLCKPGQAKLDYRGELEVKLGFTVKAAEVGGFYKLYL
jgi:Rab11 family-interacting protein 1/2/5